MAWRDGEVGGGYANMAPKARSRSRRSRRHVHDHKNGGVSAPALHADLNMPQAASWLHKIQERPVVVNGEVGRPPP